MSQPRYSFFDPGSKFLGWATGDGLSLPQAGAFRFDKTGDNYGAMLAQVADAVALHIETHRPDEVGYEEPILIFNQRFKDKQGVWRKRNDNLATLRKTLPIGARIEEVCYRRGIPCGETTVALVKTELAGFGGADKDDMVAAAQKLGIVLPDGPGAKDAADATGGWLLLLRYRNRVLSAEFDKRLWGARRGALL